MSDLPWTAYMRAPLRDLQDRALEDLITAASAEFARRSERWVSLAEGARLAGVAKGSMHHAVMRGVVRHRRILPPTGGSVLLLLNIDDVERYLPRDYPRKAKAKKRRKAST